MNTIHQACYEILRAKGMTRIFGNPGSNELPFLKNFPTDFQHVLGLHEGAVIAMADGYAQAKRQPVLVNLHSAFVASCRRVSPASRAFWSRTTSHSWSVRRSFGITNMSQVSIWLWARSSWPFPVTFRKPRAHRSATPSSATYA
jgi:Thiamine pyrophosphate enzyme, N-terminal TPP binding domain